MKVSAAVHGQESGGPTWIFCGVLSSPPSCRRLCRCSRGDGSIVFHGEKNETGRGNDLVGTLSATLSSKTPDELLMCPRCIHTVHASMHPSTRIHPHKVVPAPAHLVHTPETSLLLCRCSSGTPGTPPAHSRPRAPATPPRQAAGHLARAAATRPRAHILRRRHLYRPPPCRPRARAGGPCRVRVTTNGAASGAGGERESGSGIGFPAARWSPRRSTRAAGGRTA